MSVDAVTVSRAVAFADVAESLVEAGDDAVARAGAALRRLDLDDVPAGTPTARVVVAGTSTLGPIRAPLQGLWRLAGWRRQSSSATTGGLSRTTGPTESIGQCRRHHRGAAAGRLLGV